jgi:hypothetical protein
MSHLISDRSLYKFASGTASREEGRTVLSHLLQGCAPCARKLRVLAGYEAPAGSAQAPAASRHPALRRPATLQ